MYNSSTTKMKEKSSSRNIIIALAILFIAIFAVRALKSNNSKVPLAGVFDFLKPGQQTAQDDNVVVKVVSEESQVIEVVKNSTQAVVSITATADVPILERCYKNFDVDPLFEDFFDFRMPSVCEKGTQKQRVGAASGFIVSSDGYILTNKHVVANETAEYTVILNDEAHKGKKVIAEVLAKDPSNDIAVLKINETDLPFLELGDSDMLQVGQTAIAIGFALGEFDNTVSKGVVSGLLRSITASGSSFGQPEQLEGVVQTDAAINPGNSGGPLLDIGGKVIAMNTAVAQAENIGFAIPINEVRKVYEDVKTTGKVQRAFLGVRYIVVNKELMERNDLPVDHGALIIRGEESGDLAVVPGSPADIAGLVENDIILEVDGVEINEDNSLARIISKLTIGQKVKVKIYSKGEERAVEVELGERQ